MENAVQVYRRDKGASEGSNYWINPHKMVTDLIGTENLSRNHCVIAFAEGIARDRNIVYIETFEEKIMGESKFVEGKRIEKISDASEMQYCNEILIYRFFGRCHSRGWWYRLMQDFNQNVALEDRYDVLLMLAWRAQFMPAGSKIYER